MTSSKPQFQWDDPFFLEAQLSDEERMVRDAAKAFADDILMPRVIGDFRDEAFDPALLKDMGVLGFLVRQSPKNLAALALIMLPMVLLLARLNGSILVIVRPCRFNHHLSCTQSIVLAVTRKNINSCQNWQPAR